MTKAAIAEIDLNRLVSNVREIEKSAPGTGVIPVIKADAYGHGAVQVARRLEKAGFQIDERDPYSFYLGCVQMVMRGKKGKIIGVADPRRDGSAEGPKK